MKTIYAGLAIAALLVGCTPDEEKVARVIEQGLAECKKAEGDFAEITVVGGKDEMLKVVCEKEVTDLKLIDEYHASAKVGPSDWLVGVDSETGVWVLTQVDWEALNDARTQLREEDPPKDARARAETALAKAQEQMPESIWVRKTRLENLLALRATERGKSDDATALGETAQKVFDDAVAWARENNKPELSAELRVMLVDYYKDYASKLEMAFENIGGQDEWLQNLIKQAEKDGNKEDAENYRKTLEDSLANRDTEIAQMNARIADSKKKACEYLSQLDPSGLEGPLRERVVALKDGTNCSPEALVPPPAGDE